MTGEWSYQNSMHMQIHNLFSIYYFCSIELYCTVICIWLMIWYWGDIDFISDQDWPEAQILETFVLANIFVDLHQYNRYESWR